MSQQLYTTANLGIALAIPAERVGPMLKQQWEKGRGLLSAPPASMDEMNALKKRHWDWVVETCAVLKECFGVEAVSMFFSSSVITVVSLKLNELEKEIEEFPHVVNARLERLNSFIVSLPVFPEPATYEFQKDLLHPRIMKKAWYPFVMAQYGPVVGAALKELEEAMKDTLAGNFPVDASTVDIARMVFNPEGGILADKSVTPEENQAMSDLMAAVMTLYAGASSNIAIGPREAGQILVLASYLRTVIDMRLPPPETPAPEQGFEFLKD